MAAAGGAGGDKVYVDDVFGTFLYEGDTSATSRKLTTGLDFDDKGGLAWFKRREDQGDGVIFDTVRSGLKYLVPSSSSGEQAQGSPADLISFNSDGVNIGQNNPTNDNNKDIVLWQFLKQPGFFDIQTYTGNNTGQTLTHDLECVPAMILIKRTDFGDDWIVYHVGSDSSAPEDYSLKLNETDARSNNDGAFNDTAPTSTHFTVGNSGAVSQGGKSFVAYLFAGTNDSDSQIFGAGGDEAIIRCGSYTGNGSSTGPTVTLGFEPQWVMIKGVADSDWIMLDVMRGIRTSGQKDKRLRANANGAETSTIDFLSITSTGFNLTSTNSNTNTNGTDYTYVAIRKPNKPADSATDYFGLTAYTGTDTAIRTFEFGPPQFDQHTNFRTDANGDKKIHMRGFGRSTSITATQLGQLKLNADSSDDSADLTLDHTGGCTTTTKGTMNGSDQYYQAAWMRRPGLLDIVAYEGNGSASGQVINHNLTTTPEMIIIKGRNNSGRQWHTYVASLGQDKALFIESNGAEQANTAFVGGTINSTQFELKVDFGNVNGSNNYYVALLYASSPGIQKIGSFTKSGNTAVDCGFAAHPRWIMLKRYDSTGDWYIFYAFNNGGNDTYYLWNTNGQSVTNQNYIENYAGGFQVEGLDDGDYIFMAIA